MGARLPALPGLDYVPIPGTDPNFVFGVIRSTLSGVQNTASGAVFRRLFPVGKPEDLNKPWPRPTCYRYDVLLPDWAAADYIDPQALCRAYDQQAWDGVKDLVIIMNFRFPATVSSPPTMGLHEAYELVRGFAYERLVARGMATVLAMHVPARAGIVGLPPHVHVHCLPRELRIDGFGAFFPELTRDSGREIVEREFEEWRGQRWCRD